MGSRCFVCGWLSDSSSGNKLGNGTKLNNALLVAAFRVLQACAELKGSLQDLPKLSSVQLKQSEERLESHLSDPATQNRVLELLRLLGLLHVKKELPEESQAPPSEEDNDLEDVMKELLDFPEANEFQDDEYIDSLFEDNCDDNDDDVEAKAEENEHTDLSPYVSDEDDEIEPLKKPLKEEVKQEANPEGAGEGEPELPLLDLNDPQHIAVLYKTPPCEAVRYQRYYACPELICGKMLDSKLELYKHFLIYHCTEEVKPEFRPKNKTNSEASLKSVQQIQEDSAASPVKKSCGSSRNMIIPSLCKSKKPCSDGGESAGGEGNEKKKELRAKASSGLVQIHLSKTTNLVRPSLFSKNSGTPNTSLFSSRAIPADEPILSVMERLMLSEHNLEPNNCTVILSTIQFVKRKGRRKLRDCVDPVPAKPTPGLPCPEEECAGLAGYDTQKKLVTHIYRCHGKSQCCKCGKFYPKEILATHKAICPGKGIQESDDDEFEDDEDEDCSKQRRRTVDIYEDDDEFLPDDFDPDDDLSEVPRNQLVFIDDADLESGLYRKCEICQETFSRNQIAKHYKEVHDKPYWQCKFCSESFFMRSNLLEHCAKLHREEMKNPQMCYKCGANIPERSFARHVENCNGSVSDALKGPRVVGADVKDSVPCPECEQNFRKSQLERHRAFAHGIMIECKECDFNTDDRRKLVLHLYEAHKVIESGHEEISCPECDETMLKTKLEEHRAQKHGVKQKCSKCDLEFNSFRSLRLHCLKVHKEKKPLKSYKCEHCSNSDERFSSKRDFDRHLLQEHGIRDIQTEMCHICAGQIDRKSFKKHIETCNGKRAARKERRQKCPMCPDLDAMPEITLAYHMKKAHNEAFYRCSYCSERFFERSERRQHVKKEHQNIDDKSMVVCSTCGMKMRMLTYARHMEICTKKAEAAAPGAKPRKTLSVAGGTLAERFPEAFVEHPTNPNRCAYENCDYTNTNLRRVRGHYVYLHGVINCPQCDKPIKTRNFDLHMNRVHVPKTAKSHCCEECKKTFSTTQDLDDHMDAVHIQELKYSCLVCPAKFITKRKLWAHRQKEHKDYHCAICDFTSKRVALFRDHMKNIHKEDVSYEKLCKNGHKTPPPKRKRKDVDELELAVKSIRRSPSPSESSQMSQTASPERYNSENTLASPRLTGSQVPHYFDSHNHNPVRSPMEAVIVQPVPHYPGINIAESSKQEQVVMTGGQVLSTATNWNIYHHANHAQQPHHVISAPHSQASQQMKPEMIYFEQQPVGVPTITIEPEHYVNHS